MYNYKSLNIPTRTIMTPGPVEVSPRVRSVMSNPILGQFDPEFLKLMDACRDMLKEPFQTENTHCYAIDGTSRAGIEAVIIGLVEKGDKVLVPCYGRFSYLMAEMVERAGAEMIMLERDWEKPFEQEEIIEAIEKHNPKVVAMIHGETANGQLQGLDKVGHVCREKDIFFVVDAVATFGGVELKVDEWKIDACIAGTQKCLSVPSGMSLLTYNDRVEKVLTARYQKEMGLGKDVRNDNFISNNYLDLSQIQRYWGEERLNHHTEATTMIYALYEGLRIYCEEGAENVWKRHSLHDEAIIAGIKAMGLELYGDPASKLPTVTSIIVPEGIDEVKVRQIMLSNFGVEITGSFGPLAGKVWRIGNMGYSSRRENVLHVLSAFEGALAYINAPIELGKAIPAALAVLGAEK